MKKLIVLLLLSCTALLASAQYTTPRPPYSHGSSLNLKETRLTDNLTDGAGKDSLWISPNANINYYTINSGDTLKGSIYIGLDNITRSGVTYSKSNIYKFDKVVFHYQSGGTIKDTIFFDSEFKVDSAGNGANSRIIIPVDATKKYYRAEFEWNGTYFIQSTLNK